MQSLHFTVALGFTTAILKIVSCKPLTLSLQRLGGGSDQLFQLWFHMKSVFEGLVVVFYSEKKKAKLHIQILGYFYIPYF